MNRFPDRLLNGYRNFMSGRYVEQSARYRALAETGQKPKTLVIACCDSRAAPETIFDSGMICPREGDAARGTVCDALEVGR